MKNNNEGTFQHVQKYKRKYYKLITEKYDNFYHLKKYLYIDRPSPNEFIVMGTADFIKVHSNKKTIAYWTYKASIDLAQEMIENNIPFVTIIKNRSGIWHSLFIDKFNTKKNGFVCNDPDKDFLLDFQMKKNGDFELNFELIQKLNAGSPFYITTSLPIELIKPEIMEKLLNIENYNFIF